MEILPSDIKNSRTLQEFTKKLSHGFLEIVLAESVKITYIKYVLQIFMKVKKNVRNFNY